MNIELKFVCIVAGLMAGLGGCGTSPSTPTPVANAPTPDRDNSAKTLKIASELNAQLQAFAAAAKLENRKPFVQFTAAWCGPCRELKASMNDPLMVEAFANTSIIQINTDDYNEQQLKAAGFALQGIPAFHELDDAGKPTGRWVDGGAWDDNIPRNMAPVLQKFFRNEKS
ncbi:thioredoxin family protein [Anatilimnocola floriformis]|uniref:thioredoxin family protein n=1 Tax=Anatilimnocola floriformis TaxID=2948575 RepID=UPI0020C2290D|nr:thioredoxin family protein [Anatilimnocola floriformis]